VSAHDEINAKIREVVWNGPQPLAVDLTPEEPLPGVLPRVYRPDEFPGNWRGGASGYLPERPTEGEINAQANAAIRAACRQLNGR
jgi:hypothetical protein